MPRLGAAHGGDRDRPVKRHESPAVLHRKRKQVHIGDLVGPEDATGIEQPGVAK